MLLDSFNDKNITDFHTSGRHTLVLINNELFASGENENGECTTLIKQSHIFNLTKIYIDPIIKIKNIICGFENSSFITEEQLLFAWGGNKKGQLGLGHTNYESAPSLVMIDDNTNYKVFNLCLGLQHSVAITEKGVYGWGSNKHGQLLPADSTSLFLKPKFLNQAAQQIAVGTKYSLFLNSGQVLFNGNAFESLKVVGSFELELQNIIAISSGWTHFLLLDNTGQIFAAGRNNFGQCSNGTELKINLKSNKGELFEAKVIEVNLPTKAENLCCGINFYINLLKRFFRRRKLFCYNVKIYVCLGLERTWRTWRG